MVSLLRVKNLRVPSYCRFIEIVAISCMQLISWGEKTDAKVMRWQTDLILKRHAGR